MSSHTVNAWDVGATYYEGDLVVSGGYVYEKTATATNGDPAITPEDWTSKGQYVAEELTEYNAIAESLGSYEERVATRRAVIAAARESAEAKLVALGLTLEEAGVMINE